MATVVPPLTTTQIPPPQPAAQLLIITNPPPALSQLTLGALLDGTVVAQTAGRQLAIETALGTLTAQTGASLPQGTKLGFQLIASGPQAQFKIVSLNEQPLTLASRHGQAPSLGNLLQTATEPGASATPGLGGSGQPQATIALTVGATVSATLTRLAGTTGSAAAASTPSQLPVPGTAATAQGGNGQGAGATGSQLTVRIAAVTQETVGPATPSLGTAAAAQEGNGQGPGTAVPRPGQGGTASAGAANFLPLHPDTTAGGQTPTSSQVTGRNATVTPATAGPTTPLLGTAHSALVQGATLIGRVTGYNATGQTIVETSAGTLALAYRGGLPTGVTLTLEVIGRPSPPATPLAHGGSATAEFLRAQRGWSTLQDALETIAAGDPAVAQQIVNMVVPRANSQLAANILFFLSALRGGDIRSWLGDSAMRLLERGRPDLASRLMDDFARLGRLAEEPIAGDWRAFLVPFHAGTQIDLVRFFVKQGRHGKNDDDDGTDGTRFVLDVKLSTLGRMQFDGLLKEKHKRFELIVRSENRLTRTMRDDIRTIFHDAAEMTRTKGGISFKTAPPDFVEIAAAAPTEGPSGVLA
jgi:hypothetical protein